jgi:succinate-semialdehyde dehydrogenase/glutarate-semialdehyde dehydrogenase
MSAVRSAAPPPTLAVTDPATGEPIAEIPAGGPGEARAAVSAARAAAPAWAAMPAAERAARLKDALPRIRERAGELAELQTREMGRPPAESLAGVEAAIGAIEQYAELGPLHRGRSLAGARGAVDAMVHVPRGVAALLLPWNDPVAIAGAQIAAALVTGNVAIVKPSERAPLAVERLVSLLGLPEGVLGVVHGDGPAGRALVEHPGVDVVLHTGSVATGREVAAACAAQLKPAILELGGKDPLIVDADVDPAWAAAQAASGAFANAGQVCTSVERIYVHRDVHEPFVEALAREAAGTSIGPLVDARQRYGVDAQVRGAIDAGARLVCGGVVPDGPGAFYPPTVLDEVPDDCALMRVETFGPVAPVRPVDSFDEGLALAAAGDYALGATVLTRDPRHARAAAAALDVGTVKVNAVWGGAPGGAAEPGPGSGLGAGYGPELLDALTRWKVLHEEW